MKRVLSVGNCDYDNGNLSELIEQNFEAEISVCHGLDDSLAALRDETFDLVLVNRIFDRNGEEGIKFIKLLKDDPTLASTPVMLITNFAEHQKAAVEIGAERGFGKAALDDPQTLDTLRAALKA